MDQRVIGPYFWKLLHGLAHTYRPSRDRVRMCRLLRDLQTLFPCKYCRNAYRRKLARDPFPPHLQSKGSLVRWLIRIHNRVNAATDRPLVSVPEGVRLGGGFAKHTAGNFAIVVKCIRHNILNNTSERSAHVRMRELRRVVAEFPELWRSPWGGSVRVTLGGVVSVSRTPLPPGAVRSRRRRARRGSRVPPESRRAPKVPARCA